MVPATRDPATALRVPSTIPSPGTSPWTSPDQPSTPTAVSPPSGSGTAPPASTIGPAGQGSSRSTVNAAVRPDRVSRSRLAAAPGSGSSDTLTSPCRNTAMPSSVAAMVPNPGTALVLTTHSVSRRARSRPGAGAASCGGPADQLQQIGRRRLPGALVTADDHHDARNPGHQVPTGQHLAADVVEAGVHQNRPPRNRQREKKICTGPLATSHTTSQVVTNCRSGTRTAGRRPLRAPPRP